MEKSDKQDEQLFELSDRLLSLIGVKGEEASLMRKALRKRMNELFRQRGVKTENLFPND